MEENSTVFTDVDCASMSDFALIKVLGKGAYGKVFLVRKIGGRDCGVYYAMKVLKKERVLRKKKSLEHALMERKVLAQLSGCPFLVNLVYAFQSESKLHIIMEYVNGGELFTHLCRRRCFPPQMAKFYLAELAVALEYVHQNGVIYRDMKLENILLDSEGHVKLTDFGLSKAFDGVINPTYSYCGTVEYLAPEVVGRSPEGYTKLADWWSFGVITFELLTGCSPFTVDGDHNSPPEVSRRILQKPVPYPKNMDDVCRTFIDGFLQRDPKKRLGENDIADFVDHLFFESIDWDDARSRKLRPPFKPVITGQTDVNNFAPEFTTLEPVFTPSECPESFKDTFMGYSYISPSVMFSNNNVIGEENISETVATLANKSPFFAKYELITTNDGFLGHGTFSVCRKCRRLSDNKVFAVKIVSQKFSHHARREVRILELVNPHPNVVTFVETLQDALHHYIVLELLSGGELLHRLKNMTAFTEGQASNFMCQLVAAVSHLHSKSVVHRDLKPENILFENDSSDAKLKLVDFGFARLIPNNMETLTTPCFTLAYAAPEVIEVEDELPQYNQQCDLWSLGVIMFTMLSGSVPFHARTTTESANDVITRIRSAKFSFDAPAWQSVSGMAKDLITGLLTIDPNKRLTMAELCRHPWINMHKSRKPSSCELPTQTLTPHTGAEFTETINAFRTANKDGFHLMDVTTAPLLIKRMGRKRRGSEEPGSSTSTDSVKSNAEMHLETVPEVESSDSVSQRPSTLNIYGDDSGTAFTQYRDTKPPELKYSRDCT